MLEESKSNTESVPHPNVFGHTVFLKLRIGWFSDTQKSLVVVAECPKLFDVQCIWGRIFVSLEKIFVFIKYLQTIFVLVFP